MSKMGPKLALRLLTLSLAVVNTVAPCRASGEYDGQAHYYVIGDDGRPQFMTSCVMKDAADNGGNDHESDASRLDGIVGDDDYDDSDDFYDDDDDDCEDEEEDLSTTEGTSIWGFQPPGFEQKSPVPFKVRARNGALPILGDDCVSAPTSPVPFFSEWGPDALDFDGPTLLAPVPRQPVACCVNGSRNIEESPDSYLRKFPPKNLLEKKLEQALQLMAPESREEFESKDLIVDLEGPTAVVGDVHGDFLTVHEIINRLKLALSVGEISNVVFLGDYIDRGRYSAATLYELLSLYLENPDKVTLLRGNHETVSQYTGNFGYFSAAKEPQFLGMARDNVSASKTPTLLSTAGDDSSVCPELLSRFFEALPIGAVINKSTLAVHGGVPHSMRWSCFSDMFHMRYGCLYTFNDIWSTIMGILWSDYNPKARLNAPGNRGICNDFLIDSQYNDETARIFLNYLNTHKNFLNLKYLIHGHQWTFGTYYQSCPEPAVTTVFSALDNQSPEVRKQGAVVALVDGDLPPTEWFTVDIYHHIIENGETYRMIPPRSGSGNCEIKIGYI